MVQATIRSVLRDVSAAPTAAAKRGRDSHHPHFSRKRSLLRMATPLNIMRMDWVCPRGVGVASQTGRQTSCARGAGWLVAVASTSGLCCAAAACANCGSPGTHSTRVCTKGCARATTNLQQRPQRHVAAAAACSALAGAAAAVCVCMWCVVVGVELCWSPWASAQHRIARRSLVSQGRAWCCAVCVSLQWFSTVRDAGGERRRRPQSVRHHTLSGVWRA